MKTKNARWAEICIITSLDNSHHLFVQTVIIIVYYATETAKQ